MAGISAAAQTPDAALAFARRFACARGRPLAALSMMVHVAGLRDTMRHVRALPTVTVSLSTDPAGAEIRQVLGRRTLGIPTGRLAQATLLLGDSVAEYLKGRHRQALRTNLNHAQRLRVTASRVHASGAYLRGVERVLRLRGMSNDAVAALIEQHRVTEGRTYLARSADDVPLAFASWTVDKQCALLRVQMTAWSGRESTLARYALHMAVVDDLVSTAVPCLLAGSVLPLDAGHRYYQSLLGFQTVNLRLDRLIRPTADAGKPAALTADELVGLAVPSLVG